MPWLIERVPTCTSTMDVVREKARKGAPEGTLVVAEEMTAGRGTHGRMWHAPKGGLYLSFVLRDVKDPHLLTLALGNAVADVLEVAGAEPKLKWVNDVWVDGKKIAGILVEAESKGSEIEFLAVGIGINVNGHGSDFPRNLRDPATTLEDELSCASCIPDLEAVLLEALDDWISKLRDNRDGDIIAAFRNRDVLFGKKVRVEEADKGPAVEGIADGIDDDGRLKVKAGGTTRTFATGSVRLV